MFAVAGSGDAGVAGGDATAAVVTGDAAAAAGDAAPGAPGEPLGSSDASVHDDCESDTEDETGDAMTTGISSRVYSA